MKKQTKRFAIKNWTVGLVVAGILLGIALYVKSLIQPSTIALIGNEKDVNSCTSNIASFITTGGCGNGFVARADYVCTESGKKGYEGGAGKCIDPMVAYEHAKQYCGQTCVVSTSIPRPSGSTYPSSTPVSTTYPTPKPSSTPTPPPTLDPSALAPTCKLITYKRPGWLDGWSDDQIMDVSNNASVAVGEQLAYAVEISNPNKYQIGGALKLYSTNLNGDKEPLKVRSWGGECQLDNQMKTINCFNPKVEIAAKSTYRPLSMNVVYEIEPTKMVTTGILIKGSFGAVDFSCVPATTIQITQPPIAPGCREVSSPCLKGLVGGSCPSKVVCNSPTPTPSPTPSARACSNEAGSCMTKNNTCLTYTDGCAKADFCEAPFKSCAPTTTASPLPYGCRREQVQCFRAPCPPSTVVCTNPTATGRPTQLPPGNGCFRLFGRYACWWPFNGRR
jgi:hypothetical protein